MTSNEIVDAVTSYVRDENAKYAILIDGEWGSGKTYLYENYLVEAIDSIEIGKKKRKYNVYISLYGTSSIETLAKQLITNYLIYAKCKGHKFAKKGFKATAGAIGVASSAFSFSVGPVSADLSKIFKSIKSIINVKDMVICFDDFERCTIPINEFFGYVNNLIEHCNCKVIILADERNIGKIFANTKVEEKYLTVLSGGRKVVENIEDEKNTGLQKKGPGNNPSGEITVDEVKRINELLYSENYLYKDIKEKVIGKTLFYYPVLKDVIYKLIKEKDEDIQKNQYKTFLLDHIEAIVGAFNETDNRNLRIAKSWVSAFKKIFDTTTKYFSGDSYYEDILMDFLRYSIWAAAALKKNKRITHSPYYANQDMVYFEGHEYTHIYRYSFIDAWICRDIWSDSDLSQACKSIIKRRELEDINNPSKIHSTGIALTKIKEWYYMEDSQVKDMIDCLQSEIENNEYAYYDYSNILVVLLYLQEKGLFKGNIEHVRDIMLELIKIDGVAQEDDEFPKEFLSEEMRTKYYELYLPVSEQRKKRNHEIKKEEHEEADIYRNADSFYEHCKKMENFYCIHKSFAEYLDLKKLIELINLCDNKGLYTIRRAFNCVYHMGNLKEFYLADVDKLVELKNKIMDNNIVKRGGVTRGIALDYLTETIKHDLVLLGVNEEQME